MAEFSRAKGREIEELRRERDLERKDKELALSEVEKIVRLTSEREL